VKCQQQASEAILAISNGVGHVTDTKTPTPHFGAEDFGSGEVMHNNEKDGVKEPAT
jgi:hypothetical protein